MSRIIRFALIASALAVSASGCGPAPTGTVAFDTAGGDAWTFRKRLDYLLDSIFSFTDLPIRLLTFAGLAGMAAALIFGIVVLLARLFGSIDVSGYATTVLLIVFFGALNTLGIGLVGHYAWRTYENTKQRPIAIVRAALTFGPAEPPPARFDG